MPLLPIEPALPDLRAALARRTAAVLQAPPGAGKTTLVPLALLDEPWLAGKKIVMLEPRRLAARAAATRMAELAGQSDPHPSKVGGLVGYRIRRDTRVSGATRIEVVTEGILTRILQHDPALEEYGLVIFDEFHERNLNGDLGLALTLETRSLLRPDLRILVMSATLDGAPVAALLEDAPIVTSEGRSFPVETRWIPRRAEQRIEGAVASAIRTALAEHDGDLLAFLPGAGEIHRTRELLATDPPATRHQPLTTSTPVDVLPLFGMLPQSEQDRALRPSPPGRRKVVLATSIAETSLTIEGVTIVVDSGLARVPRFNPGSGMTRLATVRVSRASADQRRGRAGRTAPGVCYRLWAQPEEPGLIPRATAEILEADLAPLALDLAAQNIADPSLLRWLDPPPAGAFAQGRELLRELGALDAAGKITPHGREMASLPVHPRLAHLVIRGRESGQAELGSQLAALLEERDILRGTGGAPDPDIDLRLHTLRDRAAASNVDRDTLHRVRGEAKALMELVGRTGALADRRTGAPPLRSAERGSGGEAGGAAGGALLLALAYPDRVGKRRDGQRGRFLLRNGTGVRTDAPSMINADWIVAADTDGDPREAKLYLGAVLDESEILSLFADEIETTDEIAFDTALGAVTARRARRLGAILLGDASIRDPDPGLIAEALAAAIRRDGLGLLPWSDDARRLRERLAFLHRHHPGWPDVSDAALLERLEAWLGTRLGQVRKKGDLARLDLTEALLGSLDWKMRDALDRLAPTHVEVPSGSRIAVDYSDAGAPVLAVKLQELFGLTETPRVGGKVPLTLQLLSPARRPIQVTRDLASFWRDAYFEVRKDLRGRYPKHPWPEDPLKAPPTRRAKPR